MGFGKSDKPNPDLHDFPHHARIVSSYIESLGLRNLILIVHDWGGPLAMQYVIRHPQNIAGLVIMNTFLTSDYRLPPQVAAKITPAIIKESSVHPENVTENTMEAYWAPFPDDEATKAYQAFPRTFPDSPTHPSFKVIWGTGKTASTYAERVTKMIPNAKLTQVKAGHFVPEDAPDEVEKLVLGFFSDNLL
ncbi:alpha/beta fold hydrolase, partial [Candidatus Bathyarchaeota archaeon]